MQFYSITQKGIDWNRGYNALSVEVCDRLPKGVHTDFWVLTQLEDSSEILSSPEIKSRLRQTEEIDYPVGTVNTSLSRLVRKGFVLKEDWS